jgi:hypothetical protein
MALNVNIFPFSFKPIEFQISVGNTQKSEPSQEQKPRIFFVFEENRRIEMHCLQLSA